MESSLPLDDVLEAFSKRNISDYIRVLVGLACNAKPADQRREHSDYHAVELSHIRGCSEPNRRSDGTKGPGHRLLLGPKEQTMLRLPPDLLQHSAEFHRIERTTMNINGNHLRVSASTLGLVGFRLIESKKALYCRMNSGRLILYRVQLI